MKVEKEESSEQITQGKRFQGEGEGEGAVCEKGRGWRGGVWHMRRAASESLWLAWSWGEMGMQASACILSSRKKKS